MVNSEKSSSMRIVSLLSINTEMVCEIGLTDHLVAISHECDYPESILNLPRITHARVDPTLTSAQIDRQVKVGCGTVILCTSSMRTLS